MSMRDMTLIQVQILNTILDAGGVLEYDHDKMSFTLPGFSIYDYNEIHAFMSPTRKTTTTTLYQIKPGALNDLEERRRFFGK